jgi:FkbM family methyltransferase
MNERTKNIIKKITPDFLIDKARQFKFNHAAKKSYSQCGEDIIVDFLFEGLGIKKPTYADIGTHHPSFINNTYLFYKRGSRGLCVEPDPILFNDIKKHRKRDVCLNIGVGDITQKSAEYYVMTSKTMSTFSRDEVEMYQKSNRYGSQKIEKVINVPLISINEIASKYPEYFCDFVSLDTEGLDLKIIKSFDFSKFRPKVWCVETIARGENRGGVAKDNEIIEIMKDNGYFIYADTYINNIFVDKKTWGFQKN